MQFRRTAAFLAAFVAGSVAFAALTPPNPPMADLSGDFRVRLGGYADSGGAEAQAAVDTAADLLTREYGALSKALKGAGKAVARTDRVFSGDPDYEHDADAFVMQMASTVEAEGGVIAGVAIIDDVVGDPFRIARVAQRNAKVGGTLDTADPRSKISRAKSRRKRLVVASKAMRYYEKIIKRYGRNNQT